MSKIITNTASINYGNKIINTQSVTTSVEKPLEADKSAFTSMHGATKTTGAIGNDRTVVYEINLVNYSSHSCKITEILDTLSFTFAESYTMKPDSFKVLSIKPSNLVTEIMTLDTNSSSIKITNPSEDIEIPAETKLTISYTVKLAEDVPVNSIVKNSAKVSFNVPSISDPTIFEPYNTTADTNEVSLTFLDAGYLVATKEGPSHVYYDQQFPYVLSFKNNSKSDIKPDSITDELPIEFVVDTPNIEVKLTNYDGSDLTQPVVYVKDTDYIVNIAVSEGKRILTIVPALDKSIDVKANTILKVTIPGVIPKPVI